ncbi:hypothetical protein SGCZBJ_13045 [Caulobacter zeae]|uniref:DUF805 domain-containing protein n=1 Tax=Caulobacter zeae TaxID=2055137 RepID=A0A2N5DGF8_9CAUL|nr:DUF805 domain-containing protein [Caulobacter zeae]PLR25153.1 hypothetical protein SGCZBJ_13045 [Caulobacter zeae]
MSLLRALWRYLGGRCRRQEYWLSVVALMGAGWTLRFLPANTALAWLVFFAWFLLASRRLRDIGWSPWICLAPIPVSAAAGVVLFLTAERQTKVALSYMPLTLFVLWIGFWTVIGVWRSKPSTVPTPETQAEVFG